jgi:hypothetical protein
LAPVGMAALDQLQDMYDSAFPVVDMKGKLISFSDDEAVVSIVGRKNRACNYVRIQAYSLDADGNMSDAFIARTDLPESGETKPRGSYTIGTWRIWPLPQSHGVVVYVNHLCGSRIVLTKIAEIPLAVPTGKGLL